ncbi:hypothetical protein [Calothrix sp. 336/3]|uniref:hypothetical protein n=1 Tax=Calothrix sp. 336/3 TaxID=1337936 RepID=UPI0004E3F95D|nr:hypothetical protein [Calothrix sp. 336/3]AKG23769.1 hypothetical protein IJ00_22950 [Calothrix sp. 336/3]
MFELGWFSAKLFFKGQLFRDPIDFIQKTSLASTLGLGMMMILFIVKFPLWMLMIISSVVTGATMPFLLKDFRMK